eukprot:scaffold2280_cov430-Prasinococcus_capsulatus_cf.AAC.10
MSTLRSDHHGRAALVRGPSVYPEHTPQILIAAPPQDVPERRRLAATHLDGEVSAPKTGGDSSHTQRRTSRRAWRKYALDFLLRLRLTSVIGIW